MICPYCGLEMNRPEDIRDGYHFFCGVSVLDKILEDTNKPLDEILEDTNKPMEVK